MTPALETPADFGRHRNPIQSATMLMSPGVHRYFPQIASCLIAICLLLTPAFVHAEDAHAEEHQQQETAAETSPTENAVPPEKPKSALSRAFNAALTKVNEVAFAGLFLDVSFGIFEVDEIVNGKPVLADDGSIKQKHVPVPFVVTLLGLGGVLFTVVYGFINLRGFRHATEIVRGKYDQEQSEGDVSPFRALTSALSATVGLGNIAGVAIAIKFGGPGAVFWMLVAAFFGMSLKFSSCSLAQLYRHKNPDGSVSGGAMYYLDLGLKDRGPIISKIGKSLAVIYAFMIIGGSMGGGNMFQSNQAFEILNGAFGGVQPRHNWIFGLVMATLVGLVILGGIQRIGAATSKIVPAMVLIYVAASLTVIGANAPQIPHAFYLIVTRAFSENAVFGGSIGVLIWGVQRASFSNEAGLGSSAIAHAAAKTSEPVREGLVAMLEPFIDTVIVCTMTALVVIVSGVWDDPTATAKGADITSAAFATVIPWFPKILSLCVLLFAYSTMISWCYYGERGWIYLLDHFGVGAKTLPLYRVIFLCFVFIGSVSTLKPVLDFSDVLILCMAVPNILGSALMIPVLRRKLKDYFTRMQAEEMRARESAQP